jgi:hypothetical protein
LPVFPSPISRPASTGTRASSADRPTIAWGKRCWEIDEHAWLFIEPNVAQAGAGRITLAVAGLDALRERLAAEAIEHEPIETYSNGVRHVKVPDPDGNAIAFAEPPG